MRHDKDRSSKWLLRNHGPALLRLDDVTDVVSCRAVPAEVVQPRQLPDGLLEVVRSSQPRPVHFVTEIATYPEKRVVEQLRRDALTVFLDRNI